MVHIYVFGDYLKVCKSIIVKNSSFVRVKITKQTFTDSFPVVVKQRCNNLARPDLPLPAVGGFCPPVPLRMAETVGLLKINANFFAYSVEYSVQSRACGPKNIYG